MPVKTYARDAEVIFTPDSTEEQRAESVEQLTRTLDANMPEHIISVNLYDDEREVEVENNSPVTDLYGTQNPQYDADKPRFAIYVREHEPDEEDGWRYKLTIIDRMYLDSNGDTIDAIMAGNSWAEAFARAGEAVTRALAADNCIF